MWKSVSAIGLASVSPVVAMALILPSIAWPDAVFAHDNWISRHRFVDPRSGAWCCDEHDCSALTDFEVREIGGGFVVAGKYFVAHNRVLPSHDGSYWACFNAEGKGPHDRKRDVRCFFAPLST